MVREISLSPGSSCLRRPVLLSCHQAPTLLPFDKKVGLLGTTKSLLSLDYGNKIWEATQDLTLVEAAEIPTLK